MVMALVRTLGNAAASASNILAAAAASRIGRGAALISTPRMQAFQVVEIKGAMKRKRRMKLLTILLPPSCPLLLWLWNSYTDR